MRCRARELFAQLDDDALAGWQLFNDAGSQWRVGMAGPTGLDYVGAALAWRILGRDVTPTTFRFVQALEHERLRYWAERIPPASGDGLPVAGEELTDEQAIEYLKELEKRRG